MTEYIERDAAISAFEDTDKDVIADYGPEYGCEFGFSQDKVKEILKAIPAVDAVPVVRCKECKYARKSEDAFDWDGITPLCKCSYMTQPNRWYEYCSWGERRNDNAAD